MKKHTKGDRRVLRDQVRRISDPSIGRIAKTVGVDRIASSVYEAVRTSMRAYMKDLLAHSLYYADQRWRKSLTLEDIQDAIQYMKPPCQL